MKSIVIAGAGQAGYQVAASLRQGGFDGSITLINDEPALPYQRPPLSKAYLLGKLDAMRLLHRQEGWYTDNDVTVVSGHAEAIDRAAHSVALADGTSLHYDHLVIATGARNRTVPVPGADLDGVFGMRTKVDADALASRLHEGVDVVVIGAGFIGLEFAAVAAAHGASVTVIELADRPMARAVSVPTSEFFRDAHEAWGVRFHFGEGVTSIDGTGGDDAGRVASVTTSSGTVLPAGLVVYGVGVIPNCELAEAAGLDVDNGIKVDAHLTTSDPDISALGDAVSFPCVHNEGNRTRLESVQNAADQARAVAACILGKPEPYASLPWFWSDQGDLKLQIAGLARPDDASLVLPTGSQRELVVLRFRDEVLVAVETVNRPGEHMLGRRILADGLTLTSAEAQAPGFDLKAWHSVHISA